MHFQQLQPIVQEKLKEHFGSSNGPLSFRTVGGGSINSCYRLERDGRLFFCKINRAAAFPQLFRKEKEGLELLAGARAVRVPKVIEVFEAEGAQVLLMEWIESGPKTDAFWIAFGGQLAALHQSTGHRFGASSDNYMGSVVQHNTCEENWNHFFMAQRLEPLVKQLTDRGVLTPQHRRRMQSLYQRLPSVFDPAPPAVLVHGDLWSGNFICDASSLPVLIDPAAYFGHPSVDLAMTTLFGGFSPLFYQSYQHLRPFPTNYEEQWAVCNLYPLLIHLLLFGRSYLPSIENTLSRFA